MDETTRYTPEQVLAGIQSFVREHVDEKLEIDPEASVNDYSSAIVNGYGCPLEFLWELSEYFGLRWDDTRWSVWLRLPRTRRGERITKREREDQGKQWQKITSKSITVRKLAMYIARHARGVSLDPIAVLGVPCAPAGVFCGLRELPEVRGKRVAPSTPIRKVMGASLAASFVRRAAWVGGLKLKVRRVFSIENSPLPLWSIPLVLLWMPGLPIAFGWLAAVLPLSAMMTIYLGFSALAASTLIFYQFRYNPLPPEVRTFGDLARLIAHARSASR